MSPTQKPVGVVPYRKNRFVKVGDPNGIPPGNGLLLGFEIEDIDAAIERAESMGVEVILPLHRNPPDGDGGPNHWEIWLRDFDGYKVVLSSPDGTADGEWRPRKSLKDRLQ
jgi:hypothetical protein